MNYLIKYYYEYKKEFNKPKDIINETSKYKSKLDTVKTFIDSMIIKTDNKNDKILVDDLFALYITCKESQNISEFKFSELLSKYIEKKRSLYNGVRKICIIGYKINKDENYKEDDNKDIDDL